MSDRSALYWHKIPLHPRQQWKGHDIGPVVHGAVDPAGVGYIDGDCDTDVVRTNIWFENADGRGAKWTAHQNIDICSKPWNGDEHIYLRNMLEENSSE